MPITWRNVDAPSFGESNRLMETGLQTIQQAGNQFNTVIDDMGQRAEQTWNQETDLLNERYKAQIAAARSPEEIVALQQQFGNGYFDNTYGSRVKGSEMLGALDQRNQFIRQDTLEEQAFKDQQESLQWRDQLTQVSQIAHSGDLGGARAALDQLIAGGMPAHLAEQLIASKFKIEGDLHGRQIAEGQLNVSRQNAQTSREQLALAQQRDLRDQQTFNLTENTRLEDEAIESTILDLTKAGGSIEELTQRLVDMPNMTPERIQNARSQFKALRADTQNITDPTLREQYNQELETVGLNTSVNNPDNFVSPKDFEVVQDVIKQLGLPSNIPASDAQATLDSLIDQSQNYIDSLPEGLYGEVRPAESLGGVARQIRNGDAAHGVESFRFLVRNRPEGTKVDPKVFVDIENTIRQRYGSSLDVTDIPVALLEDITTILGDGTTRKWFTSDDGYLRFDSDHVANVTETLVNEWFNKLKDVNTVRQEINQYTQASNAITGAVTRQQERVTERYKAEQGRLNFGRKPN